MNRPVFHQITEKLWNGKNHNESKYLLRLLIFVAAAFFLSLINLFYQLIFHADNSCFLCNLGIAIVLLLASVCTINGKPNCTLLTVFSIPVFIYVFFISDFSDPAPVVETIHLSFWWLLAGLIFLLFAAASDSMLIFYYILSFLTLGFHLINADLPVISLKLEETHQFHPILFFTLFFIASFFLRMGFNRKIRQLLDQIRESVQNMNRVMQESSFAIALVRAERDEDNNIVQLWIEKVNNSFESKFRINLHEVKDQQAGYIFHLIFGDFFDINNILILSNRKSREIFSKKTDKWFRLHVLKPEFNRFILIFEDITQTKKKIADLEAGKLRYKVLLEAIPDIFFVIDKEGVYEDFVIKESDLFKIEDVNIVGHSIYDVGFPENMADKIYECIQRCVKNNTIETIEYSLDTHNGTFMFEMRLARLNARSVISVARDITVRKTAEFNLEKAMIKARESDRLKSAFLANLSHEIRTPLNIITNFTRLLADQDVPPEDRIMLSDAINQNGLQLLNMIDNTIHLSKIETENVEVNMIFCSINELLRDLYNKFLARIPDSSQTKLKLNMDVPNPAFGFVTDPRLLRDSLTILLDNAVKYTPEGQVSFGYDMIRNQQIRFIISDTGIGIPEEEFENIFSRFYRIKNSINDTTSGSGIGLSIASHYIKILGGELEMKSETGAGTTFSFMLPFSDGKGFLRLVE